MAQPPAIAQLGERRRLLLAESDRLRHQIAGEVSQLRTATAWVETGYSVVQSLRSWWPLLAAAGGFFMTRKRGSLLRSVGKVWSFWRLARRFTPLWRRHNPEPQG